MRRVTFKTINERKNSSEYSDLPKLGDILVNLSVKNSPKVVRTLRLVGMPIDFWEYNAKKRVFGKKGEKVMCEDGKVRDAGGSYEMPFPDADKNNKITRIGLSDSEGNKSKECLWYKAGYIGSKKYAIRCLEKQDDGTWVPKILCKGPSIFDEFSKWELSRHTDRDEALASGETFDFSTFLGGDKAPTVKVQAVADSSKLGGVGYTVLIGSKDVELKEDLINLLRAVREPSADELNNLRSEYNADREENDSMPEWRDYYEYSFDLNRIFKYTPPVGESTSSATSSEVETPAETGEEFSTEDNSSFDEELSNIKWE
jgi:hypothetical protein